MNLDKSSFRPGTYIGWDSRGNPFRISRVIGYRSRGGWEARSIQGEPRYCRARTLREIAGIISTLS